MMDAHNVFLDWNANNNNDNDTKSFVKTCVND